jgi:hypothetical protein
LGAGRCGPVRQELCHRQRRSVLPGNPVNDQQSEPLHAWSPSPQPTHRRRPRRLQRAHHPALGQAHRRRSAPAIAPGGWSAHSFVVLFEQQGTDEAVDGLIVGEAADDHERPGGLSSDLRRRQGQQALEGLDQVIDRASRCLEHRLPRRCPEDRVRCDSGLRLRPRPHFAQLGASRPQRWSTPGHSVGKAGTVSPLDAP